MPRTVQREPDAGLSMPELIVAIMLTGIAMAMIGTFAANTMRSVTADRTAHVATASASLGIDEIARVVRAAADNPTAAGSDPAVVAGSTGTVLTVLSYVDTSASAPAPSQVRFSIDGSGSLVEQRTAATANGSLWVFTGATTTRTFPGPFTTASTPLFGYLDGTGAPIAAGGALTSAQAASVASIAITVTAANAGRVGDDPVQLTTTATMPNLALD